MNREVICLDTSVLIDYFRKKDKAKLFLIQIIDRNYSLATIAITTFEIYCGLTPIQQNFWDSFSQRIKLFPSKIAALQHCFLISWKKMIALPDLLIASIALRNDLALATFSKKDFERIQSLRILD
jgi:tRNA(fMet)-specific endonuclease VapC